MPKVSGEGIIRTREVRPAPTLSMVAAVAPDLSTGMRWSRRLPRTARQAGTEVLFTLNWPLTVR